MNRPGGGNDPSTFASPSTNTERIDAPDVRYYTDITTKWQKISIPFADFNSRGHYWDPDARASRRADFHWDRISTVAWYIDPRPEKEYIYYLDDIRFVPRQTINMSKKVKEIKGATHDPGADAIP